MESASEYVGASIEIAKNPTAAPMKIIKSGSIIEDMSFVY
jgi:hypothetical protein